MYMVIDPSGPPVRLVDAEPTADAIAEQVGGLAQLVRTQRLDGTALWVNEDFVGLGLERNVLGTIAACYAGAARQPYAGPIVITGIDHSDPLGGHTPAPLALEQAMAIETFMHDAAATLGRIAEPADRPVPEAVASSLREVEHYALHAPHPQTQVFSLDASGPEDLTAQIEFLLNGILPPGAERLR